VKLKAIVPVVGLAVSPLTVLGVEVITVFV
jgi:hypothetical protein